MSSNLFTVSVITPVGSVLLEETEFIQLPTTTGEIGILASHSSEIVLLIPGKFHIQRNQKTANAPEDYFLPAGIAYITPESVSVITDYVEPVLEIDTKRAQIAQARAIKRLNQTNGTINQARAQAAHDRAVARLELALDLAGLTR